MRTCLSRGVGPFVALVAIAALHWLSSSSVAQHTQIYSFEADTDGFAPNGGGLTVAQGTTGATDGAQSLAISVVGGATFVGALTNNLHPAIANPGELGTGINYVDFDLTITAPFGPPPPAPAGFAVVGVTIFASTLDGLETGIPVQFKHEFHIDGLEAGTYPVRIYLANAHFYGPDFLNDNLSFNDVFGDVDSMVPTGLQFFINKTGGASHTLDLFIDDVVAGIAVEGDYNGNGIVDAADYTVWRDHLPDPNEPPPSQNFGLSPAEGDGNGDGFVTIEDYDYWKSRFGMTEPTIGSAAAIAVPEPHTIGIILFTIVCCCLWRDRSSTQASCGIQL